MKLLKWITEFICTAFMVALAVIMVIIFCMLILLPLILAGLTNNLTWLLVYVVLLMIGFLTNKSEESKLKSSAFREKIADAVAKSIISYKKEYERTNGFSR